MGDEVQSQEPTDDDDTLPSDPPDATPPVDFNLLILSLNASALTQLGVEPLPGGGLEVDLPMARHTIDMIAMLEDKTRGNLTGAEERLIGQVLFDLRIRYTDRVKQGRSG